MNFLSPKYVSYSKMCYFLVELQEDLEMHVTYLLPKLLLFLITSAPPLKDE